jgi:hypothetical protein
MNTYERMELIAEIESLAAEQGITDVPLLERLPDLTDLQLVTLRDGLESVSEGYAA